MKRFYGYVRVSTVRQGERGVSLQEQREAILRYGKIHGIEITEWFEERETAAKSGRPQFSRMLKLLKQRKADGLVIHKIDRSARNLRDWANLGELLDDGVDVRFVSESLDMQSRGGRLSADIQAVVAADYIRNLKEEVRKGFQGRLRQGLYPMKAPIGYLDNGGGQPKTPHPVMGPLVRAAFERYATGQYNLDTLVEEMHQRGLRTRKGKKVSRNGMSTLLNNPFYLGLIRIKKTGETFAGVHEPLISKMIYERVQDILHGKAVKKAKRHEFLFRRLLVCASCGHRLIGERQKGHAYYRCHTKNCPTHCAREEQVESRLEAALLPLRYSRQELRALLAIAREMKQDWLSHREAHVQTLHMQRVALTEKLARLMDVFSEGGFDKTLFDERKEALLAERLDIDARIHELEDGSQDGGPAKLQLFLELAGSAYLSYKSAPTPLKREIVENVTSNRLVNGKNVLIELKSPYSELATRPKYSLGRAYRDKIRTFLEELNRLLYEVPTFSPGRKTDTQSMQ